MRQQKNYLKNSQNLIIWSRVHTQRRLTATLSPTNQRAESKGKCWHPRDVIVVCAVHTRPSQSTAHQPNTHVHHVALTGMQQCCSALPSHSPNVSFVLISSSPDFDVLNQQRVAVMMDFIRMLSGNVIVNVFKSDAVIWSTRKEEGTLKLFDGFNRLNSLNSLKLFKPFKPSKSLSFSSSRTPSKRGRGQA